MIRRVGIPRIREHNIRLTTIVAGMAQERGLRVNTPLVPEQRTGWIGIDFDGSDRVCNALIQRRVFVDYRPGCGIRVSPHFYTTEGEIADFFTALDALR